MTPLQHEILQALKAGYSMYSYPTRKRGEMIIWKENEVIDVTIVQPLVDDGYLTFTINDGEKVYSLTDKGRTEVA